MKVVSIWRSRSGLAWASCSCRKWAGSLLEGAVIASNSWVCGRSPEDHAVAASTFRARYSPGPRTPPWWTPLVPAVPITQHLIAGACRARAHKVEERRAPPVAVEVSLLPEGATPDRRLEGWSANTSDGLCTWLRDYAPGFW